MIAMFFATFISLFALLVKAALAAAGVLLASLFFLVLVLTLAALAIATLISFAIEPRAAAAAQPA